MTNEQRHEYLKHGGGVCPYCQSDNLKAGDPYMESDDNYLPIVSRDIACRNCEQEWVETYRLADVETFK